MDDLTDEQRRAYWRYNITLTTILLVIWFVVAYIVSGLLAGWLNQYTFLGFPLGYYMAAQGSLVIFVIEIAVYAYLMNRLDLRYGIREEKRYDSRQDLRSVHARISPGDHPHRHRRTGVWLAEQMDWLDLHGAVAGYLRLHWHHHTHVQC